MDEVTSPKRRDLSDGGCHCPEVVQEGGTRPLCEVDRVRGIDLLDREPADLRCPHCRRGVYVALMMPVFEVEPWFDVEPVPLALVDPGTVVAFRCLAGCGWALAASSLADEVEAEP
jgi:hypothetical protein